MWDVWFHGQIFYNNIEHFSNIDEMSSFNEPQSSTMFVFFTFVGSQLANNLANEIKQGPYYGKIQTKPFGIQNHEIDTS